MADFDTVNVVMLCAGAVTLYAGVTRRHPLNVVKNALGMEGVETIPKKYGGSDSGSGATGVSGTGGTVTGGTAEKVGGKTVAPNPIKQWSEFANILQPYTTASTASKAAATRVEVGGGR